MPVEATVAPVRQQPPVFGVGLEQQPEQDPEAQAVGIAEISGCARAGLPVERVRHSDRQPGNDVPIDSLAQPTPEIGRELSGLVEQVGDGSFTGKCGGREDEVQVGGVLVVQGCQIEFQPGLDATAAPHAHARLGRVEAELVASHENQPVRVPLACLGQPVAGRRLSEPGTLGLEGLVPIQEHGHCALLVPLGGEDQGVSEAILDLESKAANKGLAAHLQQGEGALARLLPALLLRQRSEQVVGREQSAVGESRAIAFATRGAEQAGDPSSGRGARALLQGGAQHSHRLAFGERRRCVSVGTQHPDPCVGARSPRSAVAKPGLRHGWSVASVREEPWRPVRGLACLGIGRGRFAERTRVVRIDP